MKKLLKKCQRKKKTCAFDVSEERREAKLAEHRTQSEEVYKGREHAHTPAAIQEQSIHPIRRSSELAFLHLFSSSWAARHCCSHRSLSSPTIFFLGWGEGRGRDEGDSGWVGGGGGGGGGEVGSGAAAGDAGEDEGLRAGGRSRFGTTSRLRTWNCSSGISRWVSPMRCRLGEFCVKCCFLRW